MRKNKATTERALKEMDITHEVKKIIEREGDMVTNAKIAHELNLAGITDLSGKEWGMDSAKNWIRSRKISTTNLKKEEIATRKRSIKKLVVMIEAGKFVDESLVRARQTIANLLLQDV